MTDYTNIFACAFIWLQFGGVGCGFILFSWFCIGFQLFSEKESKLGGQGGGEDLEGREGKNMVKIDLNLKIPLNNKN